MKLNRQQIHERAMQVLEANPQGIRWSNLLRAVEANAPGTPYNSIYGGTGNLLRTRTSEIVKVARGTYQLAKFVDADDAIARAQESATVATPVKVETPGLETLTEQDFYASFAEWMVENDEATFASALGGNSLGGKWGTPDVIGVLKPRAQDIFKFQPQIVTAEIKVVPSQPVIAFGQAVAYRLFSHKSYIVVPKLTSSDDMNRLTSLCRRGSSPSAATQSSLIFFPPSPTAQGRRIPRASMTVARRGSRRLFRAIVLFFRQTENEVAVALARAAQGRQAVEGL